MPFFFVYSFRSSRCGVAESRIDQKGNDVQICQYFFSYQMQLVDEQRAPEGTGLGQVDDEHALGTTQLRVVAG